MTSAVALGHAGLRLRSRRVRSGRSHRLPIGLGLVVVATIATAIGVGFLAAQANFNLKTQPAPAPVADAATLEQQRLVANLQTIDAQIQRTVAQEGLLVAAYQSGQIDRTELQARLADVLKGYRDAASQSAALNLPADVRQRLQADEDALSALTQSAMDLSQAYDDGDEGRVAAALARGLEATARLHAQADEVKPPR